MSMTEARFAELLGAFGADLDRWPQAERHDAEAFLRSASHRMRDLWDSERTFDRLLATETDAPVSLALDMRVRASFAEVKAPRLTGWGVLLPRWAAGGAVAASLALGFAAGYAGERAPADLTYAEMLTVSESATSGALWLSLPDEGG